MEESWVLIVLKKIKIWIRRANVNDHFKLIRVSSISCLKIVTSYNK